jgi:hypothetical protein
MNNEYFSVLLSSGLSKEIIEEIISFTNINYKSKMKEEEFYKVIHHFQLNQNKRTIEGINNFSFKKLIELNFNISTVFFISTFLLNFFYNIFYLFIILFSD